MRAHAVAVSLLLSVPAGCAPPAAAQQSQVRDELQSLYTRVADGIKNREATPAAQYLSPGFKLRDIHGKDVPLSEVQARLKQSMEKTESISKLAIDVKRVVTRGDLALVLATRRAVARLKGPKETSHDFTSTAWALDLWQKGAEGWKLRQVEMLSLQQTLDGKPVRLDLGVGGKPPARKRGASQDASAAGVRVAMLHGGAAEPAPEAGTSRADSFQVAQIYVTPYNYGWSGVTQVVGVPQYALGPTGYMTAAQGARIGGTYNLSLVASNRAMLQQQLRYENYANQQRQEQQVQDARVNQQMQQYLAKQPPGTGGAER
jgi:hypothetical protein